MARTNTRTVGNDAEILAFRFLRERGLSPVTRNFRCRLGEIDLVMQDQDCLVFVEVRFRSTNRFAPAVLTVDERKQQKLARAAEIFLSSRPALAENKVRFDVIGIDRDANGDTSVEWLRDAFWL